MALSLDVGSVGRRLGLVAFVVSGSIESYKAFSMEAAYSPPEAKRASREALGSKEAMTTKKKPSTDISANESAVWAFPTRSRCPNCHSIKTHSYCTAGRFQWRRCRRCKETYKVVGIKI